MCMLLALLQTFVGVRIPQLTTRYSVQRDGAARGGAGGRSLFGGGGREEAAGGAEALQIHVSAINAVFRL